MASPVLEAASAGRDFSDQATRKPRSLSPLRAVRSGLPLYLPRLLNEGIAPPSSPAGSTPLPTKGCQRAQVAEGVALDSALTSARLRGKTRSGGLLTWRSADSASCRAPGGPLAAVRAEAPFWGKDVDRSSRRYGSCLTALVAAEVQSEDGRPSENHLQ